LVEEFLVCHPGVGHSWISLKVEHSKENPTVAFSVYPVRSGPEKASIPTTVRDVTRQRLADLDEELADAEAANDPERETQARREREFLLGELSAAVGLGGRDRTSLDPAERARKAVTGRIREAISRIESAHAELGHHLRRSLRTGAFCVYDPPAPTTWVL
jgi:hypothetical protein